MTIIGFSSLHLFGRLGLNTPSPQRMVCRWGYVIKLGGLLWFGTICATHHLFIYEDETIQSLPWLIVPPFLVLYWCFNLQVVQQIWRTRTSLWFNTCYTSAIFNCPVCCWGSIISLKKCGRWLNNEQIHCHLHFPQWPAFDYIWLHIPWMWEAQE